MELFASDTELGAQRKLVRRLSKKVQKWLTAGSDTLAATPGADKHLPPLLLLVATSIVSLTEQDLMETIDSSLLLPRARTLVDCVACAGYDKSAQWLSGAIALWQDDDAKTICQDAIDLLSSHEVSIKLSCSERGAFVGMIFQALGKATRVLSSKSVISADKNTKNDELISFTQILTPSWVVQLMLTLSLSRVPALAGCTSIKELQAVTVLDPALGTGNFIFGALDTLSGLYQGLGLDKKAAYEMSFAKNLYGADVDYKAVTAAALTACALTMSVGGTPGALNFVILESGCEHELGSLSPDFDTDHMLSQKYSCVVTNPPYLGRKLLDRRLKGKLKDFFAGCHNDLGNCFISKALDWCKPEGAVAVLTQSSLLSLPSAQTVRQKLLTESAITNIIELGAGIFPLIDGQKVTSTVLVAKRLTHQSAEYNSNEITYMDWSAQEDRRNRALRVCHGSRVAPLVVRLQQDFLTDSRYAFNFKRPKAATILYNTLPRLSSLALIKQGLATSDNERFIRYVWEIPQHERSDWMLYIKGRGARRWYHPLETAIYWHADGAAVKQAVDESYPYLKGKTEWVIKNQEFYFKPGLTFSFVNSNAMAVRKMPAGCIFDVGGSAIFANDDQEDLLLAYLNSGLALAFAQDLNPTINLQVGDLKQLPVPCFDAEQKNSLLALAIEATSVSRKLYGFESPHLMQMILSNTLTDKAFLDYRKEHHLASEKLIELDSRNDQIVLKGASLNLSLKESTEIISWVDSTWRTQTQRYKTRLEFIVASLTSVWMEATGLTFADWQDNAPANLKIINLACLLDKSRDTFSWDFGSGQTVHGDWQFIDANLESDMPTFIDALNDKFKSLFFQQPPFFVLAGKNRYLVPFQMLAQDEPDLDALCDGAKKSFKDLKAQLPKGARARQLFDLLTAQLKADKTNSFV